MTGSAPAYQALGMQRLAAWGYPAAGQGAGATAPPGGQSTPAAIPGAIPGLPAYTPEQKAESEAYGKQSADIINAGQKAPTSLQRIAVIQNAAATAFRPGLTAEARLAAMRGVTDAFQTIGIKPPQWMLNGAAAGETIGKEGGYLAAEMTRALGSREAASVFNQVKSIQPNIEMSTGGFQVILNSIKEGLLRDQDLAAFREAWVADPAHNGSIRGMMPAFEAAHPIEAYASKVLPYPLPKTQAAAKAGVIYNTARGPATWDGTQFQPVPR